MNITESIKFDKLQEENEILKKELVEKNEYIKFLENRPENHDCKNCPNQQQLYKEDFICVPDLKNRYTGYISKEKYDKLPSKEDKTCI